MTDEEKQTLYDRVDDAIIKLISELPDELRQKAEKIPCLLDGFSPLESHPKAIGQYYSVEERAVDCLGQYRAYGGEDGVIFIYIEAILKAEGGNLDTTCLSARQVYLHELGHALNLGELELDERGL